MRPGFYIPECHETGGGGTAGRDASMRPGFYIPECAGVLLKCAVRPVASMRPGFYIPECGVVAVVDTGENRRFNEAGILHPGMRRRHAGAKCRRSGFNEAGILHPGMPDDPATIEARPAELQ